MTDTPIVTTDVRQKTFYTTKAIVKKIKQEDGTEITLIDVPFSSLSEDRDGDNFSIDGLKDLVGQINLKRKPLYLNHGWGSTGVIYDVREMLGYWKDARIDDDGVSWASAFLDDEDDDAIILARKVAKGLPIGFSVGFIPTDMDSSKSGEVFNKCDLLEISAVGIPSNPDAVYTNGINAIAGLVAKQLGIKSKDNSEEHTMSKKDVKNTKMEEGEDEEEKQEGEDEEDAPMTLESIKAIVDGCLDEKLKPLYTAMEDMKKAMEPPGDEEEKPDSEEKEEGEEKPPKEETQPKAVKPKALEPKGIATAAPIPKEEVDKGEVQKNSPTFKSPFQ